MSTAYSVISRMTRQGFPAANTPSGTSRVTTLPAPMTVPGPDPDARQDERRAADPYVRSDFDGLAVLLTSPQLGVHRVHGREDLHARPEERVVADPHVADVEHDAVEVEEHPLAELDVRPVVAEERRLHPDRVAASAEQLAQDGPARVGLAFARGVQGLAQVAGASASRAKK